MFPDLVPSLLAAAPDLRGRLLPNVSLKDLTWLRVGGPAQVLFTPADEDDLAYFLSRCPLDLPVMVIGVGSNLLARDGGVPGVVIRLARGFNETAPVSVTRIRAGAAAPDVRLAHAASSAGIAGLAFYRGIPGTVGGALRMNAGAHGGETKDVLVEARAVDRSGRIHVFDNAGMGFTYRHCAVPNDYIFTYAIFEGREGKPAEIEREMQERRRVSRNASAHKKPHGGFNLQKPSRPQRLETYRRGWLPRSSRGRRSYVRDALQFSHQRSRRHCRRRGAAGRACPRAGLREQRDHAGMGNQAHRHISRRKPARRR